MIIKFKYIINILFISLICLVNSALACSVSEEFDFQDSAGYHYNVYGDNGDYIGYISQVEEPAGKWVVWVDGQGALNEIYETKSDAMDALCNSND
ncbi:hypothetical protein DSCO28_68490 [Desulfosarcina ovata subsp. sediminis]|uniref:Uncharacterized protein n=1 Tax=Desulfosarcina ovata subsp. sediminis TaxID=885957 RepID=A0A5K8A170_9BACT|nr:hypothetical protein [Desulfosarcina ovata]BBO86283.1 hypothetical protein DSCO28_68490 [Desulfosarcina ovata subsp. sediminis]